MRLRTILDIARYRLRRRSAAPPGTIGVIAIMKNEAMNLREWVDHYRWQGVDRIFLIDNGSEDGSDDIIAPDVNSGFIECFRRLEPHRQVSHYRDVYRNAGIAAKVEWLLMVDLDEFVYSPLGSLKLALAKLAPDADLVYMNWRLFGSAGHNAHPTSLRRALTWRRAELARHCNSKWLCKTNSIVSPAAIGIHKVKWVNSNRTVSDNELLRLNHYVTQSVEYFTKVKMNRGDASNPSSDKIRDQSYFEAYNVDMTVFDDELGRMLMQADEERSTNAN